MTPGLRVLHSGSQRATPVLERIAPARAAGFEAISLWPSDVRGVEPAALAAALAEAGLRVAEVEVIANWLPAHPAAPHPFWEPLKWQTPVRLFDLATTFAAPTVSAVELFGLPFDGPAMAASFRELCHRAADRGLRVALEFVPSGGIAGLAEAWEVVERADCANGGLMVDACHFHTSRSDPDLLARIPGERIFSIQLADAGAEAGPDMVDRQLDRLLPGAGVIDMGTFMRALAATGTRAPAGIEMFSGALDALTADEAAQTCAAALDHCLLMGA